jgi:hypothetical protein
MAGASCASGWAPTTWRLRPPGCWPSARPASSSPSGRDGGLSGRRSPSSQGPQEHQGPWLSRGQPPDEPPSVCAPGRAGRRRTGARVRRRTAGGATQRGQDGESGYGVAPALHGMRPGLRGHPGMAAGRRHDRAERVDGLEHAPTAFVACWKLPPSARASSAWTPRAARARRGAAPTMGLG